MTLFSLKPSWQMMWHGLKVEVLRGMPHDRQRQATCSWDWPTEPLITTQEEASVEANRRGKESLLSKLPGDVA